VKLLVISLFSLFLSLIFVITGNAYLLTLIGVQLGQQGIAPTSVGLIMVCYSIGFVAGAFFAPKLLMRVGHIRSFAALAALAAMASITYPLLDALWVWGLLRALGGFAVAALFVAIESWLSAVATNENRARLFALYQIAAYTAASGGQLLLEPGLIAGPNIAYSLGALLLMAAIIPLSISRLQSPPLENSPGMSLVRLWRITSLGLITALAAGALLSGFYSLVPLYATLTDVSTDQIGNLMSLAVISAMILAWPIGWLCDRIERSRVLLACTLIAGSAALLTAFGVEWSYPIRVLLLAVIMAIIASIYSIAVALTNDLVDPSERVAASSTLMLSYGLGSVLGPLMGSWLMQALAPSALFYGYAVLFFVLGGYTLYRRSQQQPITVAEQETFVVAMPESQVASEFDPRTEDIADIPIEELFPEPDQPDETIDETIDDQAVMVETEESIDTSANAEHLPSGNSEQPSRLNEVETKIDKPDETDPNVGKP